MTRIFIPDPYIGLDSQNQRIWPGEYDINDKALFGVGQSLVDTGYARIVKFDEPERELGLEDLSATKLRALAAGMGLTVPGKASKGDIIALIEKSQQQPKTESVEPESDDEGDNDEDDEGEGDE